MAVAKDDISPGRAATDQELADWVPKNFVPEDPADQAARAAGISARVMAVIKAVRAQYEQKAEL